MIFGRRKKDESFGPPPDLTEAKRLSGFTDLESLSLALDLSEGWSNFAVQRGHPELGPPARAIQQSVLPRVQELGAVRCQEMLRTAQKLFDEGQFGEARDAAVNAELVFSRARLWMEPKPAGIKQLQDAIMELRGKRTAQAIGAEAIRASRAYLDDPESENRLENILLYLEIAAAEVSEAGDPMLERSVREIGGDSRLLTLVAQRSEEERAAAESAAEARRASERAEFLRSQQVREEERKRQIQRKLDEQWERTVRIQKYGWKARNWK